MDVYYEDREYKAELRRVSVEGFSETEQLLELPAEREYFIAVYLQDVTELNRYIKENEEQRLVAGLIYIDNYDEVMNSVEEVRQFTFSCAGGSQRSTNILQKQTES